MTWAWEGDEHKFVGGATRHGTHYAKDYETCSAFPGWPKPKLSTIPNPARKAAAFPALRQINRVKLTEREFAYVKMLSCKSRIVFWLRHKFKMPAREIGEIFGNSILDQQTVYMRHRPIKRAMFAIQNQDKDIDWDEARLLLEDGASIDDIATFYGLNIATVKRHFG